MNFHAGRADQMSGVVDGRPWRRPAALLLCGLLASTAPVGAWAQQSHASSASATTSIGEIVVTAEKRSSTVQSTPISITAMSGKELAVQGITSVTGVALEVPGISMRSAGPGQTEFEMRGMSSSGGSSPTVGFYLDDTPLTPPAASLNGKVVIDPDLYDLNRIEVLRGPQGTLYGSGSMGGTIKLVTSQPDLNSFHGDMDVTLSGTQGGGANPSIDIMLNIPIVDDKVALRVVGTEKYVNGWLDRDVVSPFPQPINPGPACAGWLGCNRGDVTTTSPSQVIKDVNWESLQGARANLLIKPSDTLSIDTNLMYQRISMGGYNDFDLVPATLSGSGHLAHYQPFDTKEPFSDTFKLVSNTLTYELGFAQLTAATAYWAREEDQTQDTGEAIYNLLNYFGSVNSLGQLDGSYVPVTFTEQDRSHQFSEEVRLASSGNGRLQWLAGVFYTDFESVWHDTNATPALADFSVGGAAANPTGIIYESNNPYHIKQFAVFGEGSYKFTDQLKLTLGLRYFDFQTHVSEEQSGIGTLSGNALPTTDAFSTTASGLTPKINLSYQPSRDLTIYATASKGFRPGGVNLPTPPICAIDNEVYRPDTSWNYELGEKARLFDNRLIVNADFYYIQWTGVQQLINQPCGYPVTQNAGNAVSYGPELEVTGRLTPKLTLTLSAADTHATLTSVNPALTAVDGALVKGTPILNVPKYTESTALSYRTPLNATFDFTFRISNSYVGPSTDISYTYVSLPAYDIVDLRTGLISDQWSIFLFASNLTNTHAALSANTTSFSWVIPSLIRIATNQPRTVGVTLKHPF